MYQVRLSDLAEMTEAERIDSLAALTAAARRPNGGLAKLGAEIADFESRYCMSSVFMAQRLSSGELAETVELCDWSHALRRRELLIGLARAEST